MKDNQTITIIGAGIGGLIAALSLKQYGFNVKVYEQAPALGEVGAGLTLTSNATHVLAHIGILDEVMAVSNQPGPGIIRHWKTGETLVETRKKGNPSDKYGAPICQIHRADFHNILVNTLNARDPDAIVLNHQLEDISQDDNSVTLRFTNGETVNAALVIGCDGVRSVVRDQLFSPEPVVFGGQVAFRGLVPMELLDKELVTPNSALSIGPGRFFLRYHIRNSELVNCIGVTTSDAWQEEGWSTPATNEEVLDLYEGWDDKVRKIIEAIPEGKLFKWALCSRGSLESWIKGRVALLGDACHPTTPFLGQGAAAAVEDAMVLARCFEASDDFQQAFSRYENARVERTTKLMAMALEQGAVYQSDHPEDYNADQHAKGQNDWVFGYNPVTVDI
jgi:salicylate hydroxylase